VESDRLLLEVDHAVNLFPFMLDNLPQQPSTVEPVVDTETLQNLHKENAELRQKLRSANLRCRSATTELHRIKLESQSKKPLDTQIQDEMNELKMKLALESSTNKRLSDQVTVVSRTTKEMDVENMRLNNCIKEGDKKLVEERKQWNEEKETLKEEISMISSKLKDLQLNDTAQNKQVNILKLALNQRDSEVKRLTQLNSGLQDSVSKLLLDLEAAHSQQSKPSDAPGNDTIINNFVNLHRPQTMHNPVTSKWLPTSTVNPVFSSWLPISIQNPMISRYPNTGLPFSSVSPMVNIRTSVMESSATSTICSSLISEQETVLSSLTSKDRVDFERDLHLLDVELAKAQNANNLAYLK